MTYREQCQVWLDSGVLSPEERAELEAVLDDEKELESRFYAPLAFGTAGLRGVMGMGINRMNLYVIRHATQAFADVIRAEEPDCERTGVAICYDCRINSRAFAEAAAGVMTANGIPVRFFEALRPTPELSFAIRHYGCAAGINVTASHNPKEYNGYKVYWSDGAQLPPEPAAKIAAQMERLNIFRDVKTMLFSQAVEQGLVTFMGQETDEAFLSQVMAMANDPETVASMADRFHVVFTPFHGAGHILIPEALRRLGLKHIHCVPEQMVLDGTFPTVVSPNPENPEGFALAVELARSVGADCIIGSDPDADRVGLMVRDREGNYVTLSGNQTGVLLLDYLLSARQRNGTLPPDAVALKTIVTTEMARRAAEAHGVRCIDTFTGFKFMAEKKNQLEAAGQGKVVFSYEESYGYMLGDYVRDKDAVTASLLLAEMAVWYAARNMTLYDALQALFEKYGYYGEKTVNLVMPGTDGQTRMKALMARLRQDPPAVIAGEKVLTRKDYQDGTVTDVATGAVTTMELSGSDVLRYELSDGTSLLVRPSGTEPKIKFYILTLGEDPADRDARIARYEAYGLSLKED